MTPVAPLFQRARHSVQPEYISVRVRLQMKSPAREGPQWATVSASTKPGRVMSQLLVRMGIWVRRREPGLVPQRPRPGKTARTGARSRSRGAGGGEGGGAGGGSA